MTIIDMDIRKDPLPRRITATWYTDKTLEWSLVLGKATGSDCSLLIV